MNRPCMILAFVALFFVGCSTTQIKTTKLNIENEVAPKGSLITDDEINTTVETLVKVHGESMRPRISTGVTQVALRWWPEDGSASEFTAFCTGSFTADEADLDFILERFEYNLEELNGHLGSLFTHLNMPLDLDTGPISNIDAQFSKVDAWSHLEEDLFSSRVAFLILLNFQLYNLDDLLKEGAHWDRKSWAKARMVGLFASRVPNQIQSKINEARIEARNYISDYNIHMHHLLTEEGNRLFPEGLKLISHWGLRDELKARYKDPDGLEKQQMIQKVMERILTQEIPSAVIDNPLVDWSPFSLEVKESDVVDFDEEIYGHKRAQPITQEAEGGRRFEYLLANYRANKLADPYYPTANTYIKRKFELERELPRETVEGLLIQVLSSLEIKGVAALVEKRLGRKLEPFDFWYNGFATENGAPTEQLDQLVTAKYQTVESFQADLGNILGQLGFDEKTAAHLSGKITVDPSRGAGHARRPTYRKHNARLRTRIPKEGMLYNGFNIAIHELGHNVEQVFSLYDIDHYLLSSVPNTAFTEGFAFTFQERDLDLLGFKSKDSATAQHLAALNRFWSNVEMSAVSLIDIRIWEWMYAHPEATATELNSAVLQIAKDVWNTYFAEIYGVKDQVLLAIYSHFLYVGLYTPDYALGKLIFVQMNDYFTENGLAKEMKRMCTIGSVTPQEWMRQAVNQDISAEPLLKATRTALLALDRPNAPTQ